MVNLLLCMSKKLPASYCAYASLRHFFLQKKRITAIKRKNLADFSQIPRSALKNAPAIWVAFFEELGTSLNRDVIRHITREPLDEN